MDGLLAAPYSEFQKKLEQEKRDKAEDKRIALLRPLLPALPCSMGSRPAATQGRIPTFPLEQPVPIG